MSFEGGCYCGAIRYRAEGEPFRKGECFCRECQYISGGGPNYFMVMPAEGFTYTKGAPAQFARDDLEKPRTRDFCPTCGTHLATRRHSWPFMILKVGTLDNPAEYGGPDHAIQLADAQPFHCATEGIEHFDRFKP